MKFDFLLLKKQISPFLFQKQALFAEITPKLPQTTQISRYLAEITPKLPQTTQISPPNYP